jgi:hypothetical protein
MIPDYNRDSKAPWPLLPPGVWDASIEEIEDRFAINAKRILLFNGLRHALENLFNAGCKQVFLDGSYVTEKPIPGDYELCWDSTGVNPAVLDPVMLVFSNGRAAQKQKYLGEFFPVSWIEGGSGKPFLEFFQIDKHSGEAKGIIRLHNYLQ